LPTVDDDLDVLIVGAGISGLSAAWHLRRHGPGWRWTVLEQRQSLGGTWDLFRYPGVRSDSDMHTLGFCFRPWRQRQSIAAGETIRRYLQETAEEAGLLPSIRFGVRVTAMDWCSRDARWVVQAVRTGSDGEPQALEFRCRFVFVCSGYYRHDAGHQPDWEGLQSFAGVHVHSQHWPAGLEVRGRRVVVIGSGATAVSLVPALARAGAQVVQLQRTPSYLLVMPSSDAVALALQRMLPARWAATLTRVKNVAAAAALYAACRRWPVTMRRLLQAGVRRALPRSAAVSMTHFQPPYGPWEQRLCLVPDGDYFAALGDGSAQVVTGRIGRFTAGGIRLEDGRELAADIVVSATGLQLQVLGGARLSLDGRPVATGELLGYKGVMFCGIPNLAVTTGYVNASWTLKADLTSLYVCRLLRHLRARGARVATPRFPPPDQARQPLLDLAAGYVRRGEHLLPRQGTAGPWKLARGWLGDTWRLRLAPVDDGVLAFDAEVPVPRAPGAVCAPTPAGAVAGAEGGEARRQPPAPSRPGISPGGPSPAQPPASCPGAAGAT
jgi:cation diffusion facilitator CzcD-associated flavoprotein CzcO